MKELKIDLSNNSIWLNNLHDEIINKFVVKNKKLTLCFNELHFNDEYSKCEIIFSGFDDIYSDIFIEFYNVENCKICDGRIFYLSDFINNQIFMSYKYEFIEIYTGYKKTLIRGSVKDDNGYIYDFNLFIDSKFITYKLFE